jgi:hypothetical protein
MKRTLLGKGEEGGEEGGEGRILDYRRWDMGYGIWRGYGRDSKAVYYCLQLSMGRVR